ncbi:MAG: DMT family transporter [Deferrisomatales bacterium]|nr:DMT family transporter [Deferrisomatales bacterium]
MDSYLLGVTAALVSAVSWALGSVLWRRVGGNLSAFSMNLMKGLIGSAYLTIALLVIGVEQVSLGSIWYLGVSGVVGIAVGDTLFFQALLSIGPRLTSLIGTLTPVTTSLVAFATLGERPGLLVWVGIGMTCVGVGWVLSAKTYGAVVVSNKGKGIACGVLSVLCTVIGIILAKKALAEIPAVQASLIRMFAGTVALGLWGVVRREARGGLKPFADPGLLGRVAGIMVLGTFGGFFLSLYSLKLIDASIASSLNSTSPLFVIPVAAVVLKERITVHSVLGAGLAVCGVVLIITGG